MDEQYDDVGTQEVVPQRRALVTDDDRFFREVLGDVLREAGYDVVVAATADEAFAYLVEHVLQLSVLVLDLHMPGLSGAQLVERIRQLGGETDLAVVILTGASLTEQDKEQLEELGADDVIAKTLSRNDLLLRIEQAVTYKGHRQLT